MSDAAVYGTRGRVPTSAPSGGSGNPFVVGPIDTTTPFSGSRLLDDGDQLRTAIANKDWLSGSLASVSMIADAVSFALNPIAGLVAMGVGWVLDHIEPLKSWLNELAGNAGAVAGGGATWDRISTGLQSAADDLLRSLDNALVDAHSRAVDAYKRLMGDVSDHLGMAAGLAGAISTGLGVASTIVQFVHDLVRDAIADVVGTAVSCIIPLPNVIADLVAKVAKWTTRIGTKIDDLIRSFDKLHGLFTRTDALLARVRSAFDDITAGSVGGVRAAVDKLTPEQLKSVADDLANGRLTTSGIEAADPRYLRPTDTTSQLLDDALAKGSRTDPETYIGRMNPLYDDGPVWQNNCGPCSRAFADTYQGVETRVAPGDINRGEYMEMRLMTNTRPVTLHPDPAVDTTAADFTTRAYDALADKAKNLPDGSAVIVGVDWDGAAGGGHWFNGFVRDGKLHWADAQVGEVGGWPPGYTTEITGLDAIYRTHGGADWEEVTW